ncbi:TIGR00270 family protein [Candidatus Woesearchaeota archaeon]|nr:TIGR00270 family protein [Candidatus Woesearchaeota archaeon]
MGSCDLCGREAGLFKVRIEGSLVNVCEKCGRFGKIIEKKTEYFPETKKLTVNEIEEEILVESFNKIVRKEREKRGLTQEELAKTINEKVSLIQKLENKEIEPDFKIVKKLEKYFGIVLTEKQQLIKEKIKHYEIKSYTLGDLIHEKQKGTG